MGRTLVDSRWASVHSKNPRPIIAILFEQLFFGLVLFSVLSLFPQWWRRMDDTRNTGKKVHPLRSNTVCGGLFPSTLCADMQSLENLRRSCFCSCWQLHVTTAICSSRVLHYWRSTAYGRRSSCTGPVNGCTRSLEPAKRSACGSMTMPVRVQSMLLGPLLFLFFVDARPLLYRDVHLSAWTERNMCKL